MKRGKPVQIVSPNKDWQKPSLPILVAVSARGARKKIDEFLSNKDLSKGAEYILCA